MTAVLATIGGGLEQWIEQQADNASQAVWVELRHIAINDQHSKVQRWSIADDRADTCRMIWSAAQQWSDSVGAGSQRFCIALLDSVEHVVAQYMTRVGSEAVGGHSWDSEPASLEGVTKQLMRHNEANAKLATTAVQSVVDRLCEENERLTKRIQGHEERHMEMLKMYEELIGQTHERESAAEQARSNNGRKDQLVEKLGTLVPVAVSKLMGVAAPDPVVTAFAHSIDGKQLAAMGSFLRPEQQLALATMIETHANVVDDSAAPTAPPAANSSPTPTEAPASV